MQPLDDIESPNNASNLAIELHQRTFGERSSSRRLSLGGDTAWYLQCSSLEVGLCKEWPDCYLLIAFTAANEEKQTGHSCQLVVLATAVLEAIVD
eukprot:6482834-Amphidinium_carterae.1